MDDLEIQRALQAAQKSARTAWMVASVALASSIMAPIAMMKVNRLEKKVEQSDSAADLIRQEMEKSRSFFRYTE